LKPAPSLCGKTKPTLSQKSSWPSRRMFEPIQGGSKCADKFESSRLLSFPKTFHRAVRFKLADDPRLLSLFALALLAVAVGALLILFGHDLRSGF